MTPENPSPDSGEFELPPEVRERPGGLLSSVDPHLVMYHDPRSLHAEQYRACRTNLVALNRSGGPWAIVVTSSKKGEGKSVSAANLAACLAELPAMRVCLIDVDFRSPSQCGILGVPAEAGVSELFEDRASLTEIVHHTIIPNLDLIGTGEEPSSPAELLGSERFANLISELKRRYTWVVIDTPPVNPYTDACTLSKCTNGAVIIVRMDETSKDLVDRTVTNLRSAGGRVLGTFLTGLSPDRDDADRQGYYRVDAGDYELARQERDRRRSRERTEKRLRKQEKAFIKRQKDDQGTGEDGPTV